MISLYVYRYVSMAVTYEAPVSLSTVRVRACMRACVYVYVCLGVFVNKIAI